MDKQKLLKLQKLLNSQAETDIKIAKQIVQENEKEVYEALLKELPANERDKCKYYFEKYRGNLEKYWPNFYTDFIKRV